MSTTPPARPPTTTTTHLHPAATTGTPLTAGHFTLRPADPETDTPLLHRWMNDPEVARYWEMAQPAEHIEAHLRHQYTAGWSTPCLGLLNNTPMSYWELYRADLDPHLAPHYPARPHDAGIHLLLGPAHHRGRGLGAQLLRAVTDWQLAADPRATRVVAEPDIRNIASVRSFERAGFTTVSELELPDKRAALMARERSSEQRDALFNTCQ